MQDNRKRIIAGLAAVGGAAGAFFGTRAIIRWRQRRSNKDQRLARFKRRVTTPPVGSRFQPQDQPDRQPIPATGGGTNIPPADTLPPMVAEPVTVSDLAGPLVQYLLTFNEMIDQLRARRREGNKANDRSLTPDDRTRYQDTLDRLEDQMQSYDEGDVEEDSLQERLYHLALKVRDALQNLDYTDSDLFRINGEVRTEACHLLEEIEDSGPDFVRVRQIYECN